MGDYFCPKQDYFSTSVFAVKNGVFSWVEGGGEGEEASFISDQKVVFSSMGEKSCLICK